MSRRWWLAFAAVVAFAAIIGIWATQSWSETQRLVTPEDVDREFATFECGPVFSDLVPGTLQGEAADHPLSHEPCTANHDERRWLGIVDLVAAVGLGIGVIVLGRRSRTRAGAAPPGDPELADAI